MNKSISIENARIMFKNFSGKEQRFNPAGRRNFCVLLPEDICEELIRDGWSVKYLKAREEGDMDIPYLQVSVSYGKIEPSIYTVTKKNKVLMTEDTVGTLDWIDFENVDLIIRPYNWEVNGKTGIKAYVQTMYVTIQEDPFAEKYSFQAEDDMPF